MTHADSRHTAFAGARPPGSASGGRPAAVEIPPGLAHHEGAIFARALGRRFEAAEGDGRRTIEIYEEIGGWGVTAGELRFMLRGAGDVLVKLNSPGGDVFDGLAIFNELRGHSGQVTVEIVGLAASAASIVAMAGDEIRIAANGFIMIHNAWTMTLGDRMEHRAAADVLEKVDGALAATYAARGGFDAAEAAKLMDAETWFTAEEAVERGLADQILDFGEPQAAFDLSGFRRLPAALALYSQAAAGDLTEQGLARGLRAQAGRTQEQAAREAKALLSLPMVAARSPQPEPWALPQPREELLKALRGLSETMGV